MTNKKYERFASILSEIEENGISTYNELDLPQNTGLKNEFYFAAQDFINYYALASKTHKNKKGEIVSGNADKVKFLINYGGMELYDIQTDVLLHIIKKADRILAQSPISKKVFYTYKTINNKINDMLRKIPDMEFISMDETIISDTNEDGTVLSDIIGDITYEPEHNLIQKETINELKIMLNDKLANKRNEEKELILREMQLLSKHPAEVLIHLCARLGMKSNAIMNFIIKNGVETSCEKVIVCVSERFNIPLSEIRKYMSEGVITEKDLKLDTKNENKVIEQVYHLRSRASKRIETEIRNKSSQKLLT